MLAPLVLMALISLVIVHAAVYFFASLYGGRRMAWLRIDILIAVTILLALIGYRWNHLAGALFLPVLGHAFFWASIAVVSQSLFPVFTWDHRLNAFKALASYIFDCHRSSTIIENGHASRRIDGQTGTRLGAGVILVGVAQAAVMQTAVRFSRVIGPGVHFVRPFEQVKSVVDLHHQIRSTPVQATTKDGVPVEARVFAVFRTDPGTAGRLRGTDFGYSSDNIRQAIYSCAGVGSHGEDYGWESYALQVAETRFREIVGRFRFDQLIAPDDPDQVPRQRVGELFKTAVGNDLRGRGIQLLAAGFGPLGFPAGVQEQVTQQRIDTWKAHWRARADSRRAAGAAVAEQALQVARADAEWELTQGLINGLLAAQGLSGIGPADLVTWQLFNAIESMSADPTVHPLLPQETANALATIRNWLEKPTQP